MVAILDFRWEWFKLFLIYKSPDASYQVLSQLAFGFRRRSENGGHLGFGFPIGMILAIFNLQVTPMLPTKFRVNWPFGSGEEAKNRFSRWRPSWISDPNDFSYFWSTSHPELPTKFRVNWSFGSGEEAKNRFSRWPPWISDRYDFSYFWSTSHPDASYQVYSQLAQGCRKSRLLKQLLTMHDGRQTLTDHNTSSWALCAQVS